ncbi:MAG: DUF5615 family PIN-like protein [Chlamydiae bacterium]|nr:DUF5615 family PIN-like protein [Chlamydiota bacterium]MBI3276931.1 DUF5615 family PIN-like protein [Chlamydiota bacterium]
MKIKLDENLPFRLVQMLEDLGHSADTVPQEGLSGKDDLEVWKEAQRVGAFFITQDLDFSDERRFSPGTHFGILLLRLHEPGRNALVERIEAVFRTEKVEKWMHCFVIVTEHKIRVRYPHERSASKGF